MKALSVRGVRLDRLTNTPVVTLREDDAPRRQFEIFIGAPEAASIKIALDDEITPRPLTHDLFVLALERLNVSVTRVVLTHVSSGTYYADLVLMPDGEEVVVSSRPSDAIAIALRASCPIYASDELIDMVGEVIEEEEEAQEQSGIIDEFKNFIENINPEDFA
ncbi:MAG: bifunctional nuclease family protein [Ilumatobacteraceae bacterium]